MRVGGKRLTHGSGGPPRRPSRAQNPRGIRRWQGQCPRLFRRASKADLQRTGFHPERGEVTLQVQLETLAGHDLNHLEQIQRLAAQHKARP